MEKKDNVIQFPAGEKQWREIETSIRLALAPYAPPKDLIDHMLYQAKKVFLKHCSTPFRTDVSVPQDSVEVLNDVVEKITQYFQNIMNLLMVEIMIREKELYYHQLGENKE